MMLVTFIILGNIQSIKLARKPLHLLLPVHSINITMSDNTVVGNNMVNLLILTGKMLDTSYIYQFCTECHLQKYSMGLHPIIPDVDSKGR